MARKSLYHNELAVFRVNVSPTLKTANHLISSRLYSTARVYKIRRVIYFDKDSKKKFIFFTNALTISPIMVTELYHNRWRIELFRDSKQYAGITNCQSTDFRKMAFHFNASLTAINLAKAACKRMGIPYSISSCKSMIHNAYMLERFICVFGIQPDTTLIGKIFKELILFTARAA